MEQRDRDLDKDLEHSEEQRILLLAENKRLQHVHQIAIGDLKQKIGVLESKLVEEKQRADVAIKNGEEATGKLKRVLAKSQADVALALALSVPIAKDSPTPGASCMRAKGECGDQCTQAESLRDHIARLEEQLSQKHEESRRMRQQLTDAQAEKESLTQTFKSNEDRLLDLDFQLQAELEAARSDACAKAFQAGVLQAKIVELQTDLEAARSTAHATPSTSTPRGGSSGTPRGAASPSLPGIPSGHRRYASPSPHAPLEPSPRPLSAEPHGASASGSRKPGASKQAFRPAAH
jgi:chromosome segregation ATPase